MKRFLLLLTTVALAVGATAFLLAKVLTCTCGPNPPADRLRDLAYLTQELGLSEGQREAIQALHVKLDQHLTAACSRHCGARAELARALSAPPDATEPTEAFLRQMCQAYETTERATFEHLRATRALLQADQQARFDALLTACLCAPCPACQAGDPASPATSPPEPRP